jgi:hypothetical protein
MECTGLPALSTINSHRTSRSSDLQYGSLRRTRMMAKQSRCAIPGASPAPLSRANWNCRDCRDESRDFLSATAIWLFPSSSGVLTSSRLASASEATSRCEQMTTAIRDIKANELATPLVLGRPHHSYITLSHLSNSSNAPTFSNHLKPSKRKNYFIRLFSSRRPGCAQLLSLRADIPACARETLRFTG